MGSSQADIEVSYGVSNDFFRLWLDERMNYTCGVFKDRENYSDSLNDSQEYKLEILSQMARIGPHTESVLDIGCGWGANIEYQAKVNKVPDVHGVTLSPEQYKYCLDRSKSIPNITVTCQNCLDYVAPRKFDAIMCICMMEHLVSPEDARAGRQIDIYRDFFRRCHEWSKPGTYFALQAITRCNVPRNRQDLDEIRHSTYTIFPNAVTPRVEDLIIAANPYYETIEMHSRRFDYKKTTSQWRDGLRKHGKVVREKWGNSVFESFDRYLTTCIKAFEHNWQSLHQFSLKRLD